VLAWAVAGTAGAASARMTVAARTLTAWRIIGLPEDRVEPMSLASRASFESLRLRHPFSQVGPYSASFTSILPEFSPAIRPMSAVGAAAIPSLTVSWYLILPAFSQPAMSRWKSP
jgi:hypothetical protein